MRIRPFKTIAASEAAEASLLEDLSRKTISQLVELVVKHDPGLLSEKSEEGVFIDSPGDKEGGLKAHKKYRIFPEEDACVRAFCISRTVRVFKEFVASAPKLPPNHDILALQKFLATAPPAT